MDILIWSNSPAYNRHAAAALNGVTSPGTGAEAPASLTFVSTAAEARAGIGAGATLLIHASSVGGAMEDVLASAPAGSIIAVAADIPDLRQMLHWMQWQIRGYFNSYMAPVHYRHLLQLLSAGQSWFAPDMLRAVIQLARANLQATADEAASSREANSPELVFPEQASPKQASPEQASPEQPSPQQTSLTQPSRDFSRLSDRERQIARAVADGLSNKQIANQYGISERTVKTHLTHIFDKLGITNRVALATRATQSPELLRDPA